ncbi:MAG: PilZ domain-containing protein [Gammaproteobacteria bacterium]|jgi:Tfp pilus assembly protein PilZ|nr:PilZ domain-containing protein [Gammaproteobacteria bacterium]MCH1550242.1 PilZ domain-containing protein [Pseudomonadales bacterium]
MTSNIIKFNRSRAKKLSENDQRIHPRLISEDRLFLQILQCKDQPSLTGTTLACTTVDMSMSGLQLKTNQPLPLGSTLEIWIDVAMHPSKFFLTGEVRWTRPTMSHDDKGDELYFIGIQLKTGTATDLLNWRDFQTSVYPG